MRATEYFPGAVKLSCEAVGAISPGQDGAVSNGLLFRLDHAGNCTVYSADTLTFQGQFVLDKCDKLTPHSNAVCFGTEFAQEGDAFPLLYTNLYNNYAGTADEQWGTCCAYRIIKDSNGFSSQLVQVITIEFVRDSSLWCSPNVRDARPYGNFVVDRDTSSLWAFVMRDEANQTRFFRFPLPTASQGQWDSNLGANIVKLTQEDICDRFDSEYLRYIQGATCIKGYLYSCEGFASDKTNPPAIHIFDANAGKMVMAVNLMEQGLQREPELLVGYQDAVYYADAYGQFYRLWFTDEI